MIHKLNIHCIEKALDKGDKSINEISQYLPCHIHINNLSNLSIKEMDYKVLQALELTKDEIIDRGYDLLTDCVNKNDLDNAVHLFGNYTNNRDTITCVDFLQRIYYQPTGYSDTLYTTSKIMNETDILNLSIPLGDLELFQNDIFKLIDEVDFTKRNTYNFCKLTAKEIEISGLLAKGYSTLEVSEKLISSINTIKKHRTSIYRKMEVTNYFEFYRFARAFGLHA